MGRDNTRRNIKKLFYWHNLYNDVASYVATCAACSKNKKANKRKRAGMTEYHAGSPMERVHLNVVGPFNISSKGNKYVLGMIDQFTKWLGLLSLDDTLPYDEAEHSLLGDAGLETLFDDNEVVASAAHQNNASVNDTSPTLDGNDNDPIITSTPSPPSSPSTQVIRRGCKRKQSTWLRDYVTD